MILFLKTLQYKSKYIRQLISMKCKKYICISRQNKRIECLFTFEDNAAAATGLLGLEFIKFPIPMVFLYRNDLPTNRKIMW